MTIVARNWSNSLVARESREIPPAPRPRETTPGLVTLLSLLVRNPLHAWTREHFEALVARGGLPFVSAIVVSDPDAIQHVLVENAENYRKDDLLQRILSPGLSNGLLTVEGEQWRKQRRAVASLFSRRAIFQFAPAMAEAADALAARWSRLPDGTVVDVAAEMTRVTLNVLERTIFSDGIGRDVDAFRNAMRNYFDTIGRIDPLDALGVPGFVPRPTRWRARKSLRFFNSAIDDIIAARRQLVAEANGEAPRDILTLLFEARDPRSGFALSEEELRANILTLIAAGHETTANALSWSLYLLGASHVWRAHVVAEVRSVSRLSSEDCCEHLVLTRAVIDEALRLYPPIAAISRVAMHPDSFCGEQVAPGTMVIVAPYVVHRHRRLWQDPDAFDPRRFLPGSGEPVHRYAYLPFGAGPRICLGAAFALQEATIVLARILRSFDLRPLPGHATEPMLRITLRPKDGLPMVLRHRVS